MFHPLLAAAADLKDPLVPSFMDEVSVSSEIENNAGKRIKASCSTIQTDHRHCKASLIATSPSGGQTNDPALEKSGLASIALARDIGSTNQNKVQTQAFKMNWSADVEFLPAQELQSATDPLAPLARYMGLIAHKIPNAKILCQTFAEYVPQIIRVLETLGGSDPDKAFTKVYFTGRSESFDHAEVFAPWSSMIEYRENDIEGDTPTKGLEASYFDVILDLHSSIPVKKSPKARKALMTFIKPLGFYVSCRPLNLPGADVSDLGSCTVMRRRKEITPPTHGILVIGDGVASQHLNENILFELRDRNPSVETSRSFDIDPSGKVCIIMSDSVDQALKHLDSTTWKSLKRICFQSAGIIWVTQGATSGKPLSNMVTGLLRTVRSEIGHVPMVTFDLDAVNILSSSQAASKIIEVYDDTFRRKNDSADRIESEFQERSGQILIPRLVEDVETNAALHTATTDARPTKMPFKQAGRPLRVNIGSPGLLDSLHFVDDEDMADPLAEDCIEVEIKASGLNFRDVMMTLGQIAIDALGGELSGIVKATGKSVTNHRVGDRVAGCHLGTFRNFVRPKALLMTVIPDEMSFETAAALPVSYCTAYHSLFNVARIQEGQTVLIHAASGGVGQAAIELCHLVGAEVFVTVGSSDEKTFLIRDYGLKPENIFYSRDDSFAKSIMTATKGKGVDVILISLAGEALQLTWTCIAPYGRFIELGNRDFFINSRLYTAEFTKNVAFSAVDLVSLVRDKPNLMSDVWTRVMDLLRIGSVRPPTPITTYSMSEIHKSLSVMHSGSHTGKLVVVPSATDIVMAIPRKDGQKILDPDSSYILVGGLGGIGRAIAIWMFEHGARNLVFINRSGLRKQEAKDTIALLQNRGVNAVVLSCDVSDASKLTEHVSSIQKIRPIKGVIQGAMVSKDMMLLDKMSADDWNTSVKPKVQGTINLHDCLPKDLDFFIMLSSVSGITGNASQGNNAAASTFMDAFAEHRRSLGLRGTSLDLGVIRRVGHVAEDVELTKAMERQGLDETTEKDLVALIQSAILGRISSSQVVTGLGTYKPATASGSVSNSPLFSEYRNMFPSSASPGGGDSVAEKSRLVEAAK